LKPIRQFRPKPPEDGQEHPKGNQGPLYFGRLDKIDDQAEGGIKEQEAEAETNQEGKQAEANWNFRLRRREFAAAALRANFRAARIQVLARAELHVIRPAAGAAIKRLACRHLSALVAVLHFVSLKNG
jgi:hypothetical protein